MSYILMSIFMLSSLFCRPRELVFLRKIILFMAATMHGVQ